MKSLHAPYAVTRAVVPVEVVLFGIQRACRGIQLAESDSAPNASRRNATTEVSHE
jgi:hypothetical protein